MTINVLGNIVPDGLHVPGTKYIRSLHPTTYEEEDSCDMLFADHTLVRADRCCTELRATQDNIHISSLPEVEGDIAVYTRQKRGFAFTRTCIPAAILVVVVEEQGDCDSRPYISSTR